ncbi:MAG: type II toxin-antitoxin system prevent-host-death family antitoxin [Lachnospiraceae bacterium]|nr:type II toxin-antitoxin system prevent-host-death family antitoxin [Lachnospiraceae bacterium]
MMVKTKTASATEMQNNFGRYLSLVQDGNEIIVTKNGKAVGRFIPQKNVVSYLTDSLIGILKGEESMDQAREEGLRERYEITD